MIDSTRNSAHEAFQQDLLKKEYYRNRKRIEDINEICDMYSQKIKEAGNHKF